MKFICATTAGLMLAVATAPRSQAAESIDWQAQFAGLDGIFISCVRTLDKKYTSRICDKLISHVDSVFKKAGLVTTVGENYLHKSQDTIFIPSSSLKRPLNLTFHVRATDPGPLGIDVRVNASVSYAGAIEKDADDRTARRGELLLWQTGATASGTGSTKKLESVMIKTIEKRVDPLLALVVNHWTR